MEKLTEYKFEFQWGGEDTWFTKANRWAQKQKFPINHLAMGLIVWLWEKWVDGKVQMEMASVDKQAEEIVKQWEEEEKQESIIESKPSEVEGLDDISIHAPWSSTIGDWNDSAINYKKWR